MVLGLHELDPAFRKASTTDDSIPLRSGFINNYKCAQVTLENDRMRALVRDLQFHRDPVGK